MMNNAPLLRDIDARRAGQRAELIAAAEARIARDGLAALKARDLAADIGISLGAIYNLVADLDDLVLRVIARALDRLDTALRAADAGCADMRPVARLTAIAIAYRQFAADNLHLWRAMFEHRLPAGKTLPDWAVGNQTRLFRHIHAPLEMLLPQAGAAERAALALTLFGAVHGVVAFGLEGRVVGVPVSDLDGELTRLVAAIATGLQAGAGLHTP